MPIQAPQWTEFLSCPVCYNVFSEKQHRPISLACGHTVCKSCLSKLQQRKCPFDQSLISRDIGDLPVNFALLQLVCATAIPESKEQGIPKECRKHYEAAKSFIEELALLLKPVSSATTGSIITPSSSSSSSSSGNSAANCVLSRPMQRKLITLVNCQLVEEEGRSRALRAARSLGERTVTELILQHQNPQQLSSNLWAAVRGRGCQFLGPAMQEEVLHLILLALEDGSALSRKVLVLFVVQRLECQYPQASKTAIGHVVQLLYRASCFKVTKRDQESSLMQLKEEYRSYETLRREHDTQIVQIAMEAGLRIAPDQWSSLLYGDSTHKSHMQSIIDKLQTPQTFSQSVSELLIALQRTGDPHSLQRLRPQLEFLSSIDPSPDVPCPSWENLEGVLRAAKTVVEVLVTFLQNSGHKKHDFLTPFNNVRYKTSMCRDFAEKGNCPRGSSCTFAHSEEELERYRQRNKKAAKGSMGLSGGTPAGKSAVASTSKQEKLAQSRKSLDSEDGVEGMVTPLQSFNLEENSLQGVTHSPQGAVLNPHGPSAPSIAAVLPNAHCQQPPVAQQALPPGQEMPANIPVVVHGQTPQQVLPGQVPAQGYQIQGQVPQPGYQGQMAAQPGYPMGQIPQQPGYQGQMPPQPKGMPSPPMGPPPHYDYMGYSGAGMGRNKYPLPPPINPMMYMYPGMHPYMPYYHPGYMSPGGMRYPHFEGYRPQLNPYAEPWSPHSQQQFCHEYMAMTGQAPRDVSPQVKCTVCSQRKQQSSMVTAQQNDLYHTCGSDQQTSRHDIHPTTSDHNTSRTDLQYSRSDHHTCGSDHQPSRSDPYTSRADPRQTRADHHTCGSEVHSPRAESQFSRPNHHVCGNDTHYSTADAQFSMDGRHIYDSEGYSSRSDSHFSKSDNLGGTDLHTSRPDLQFSRANLRTSGNELQTSRPDVRDSVADFKSPTSVVSTSELMTPTSSYHHGDKKHGSQHKANSTVAAQDAVIQRQSLSTLQERRNSLLAMLKERQKHIKNEHEKNESKESDSMKSYRDLVERMKQQSNVHSNVKQHEETLEHPVPRDAGPPGLKSHDPTHENLFKRLGAISGMPPRSVNDSIMASWMTATLTAASTKNTSNFVTSNTAVISIPKSTDISGRSDLVWSSASSQSLTTTTSSKRKDHSIESSWSRMEDDFPYWKDISRTVDSPSPTPMSVPMSQNLPGMLGSSQSQLEVHPSIAQFFTQLDHDQQEDVIPFDPPIISKFGPISRLRTKSNNTVPLKVTADEMMKTIPVTAVTPLSRPPLPNATTVPSRFTLSSASSVDTVPVNFSGTEDGEPEPYSLWKKEVIQLEQKAQQASTEDERLSVELQAVEMQISMKQQELQQASDVHYSQIQASEYLRHQTHPLYEEHPLDAFQQDRYSQHNYQ